MSAAGRGGRARALPWRLLRTAVCVALGIALTLAPAAATTSPSTLPFPPPLISAEHPIVGRFHSLPSLACDTRSPVTDGRRGYYYQEHGHAPRVFVAGGDGTCASPIEDPVQLALYANQSAHDREYHAASSTRSARGAAQERLKDMRSRPPTHEGVVEDVIHTPLGADADAAAGLHYEQVVHRLLALHRNSFYGGVLRYTGDFDVLAVSRVTAGVCLREDCEDMSALAILEHSELDLSTNGSVVPVLTYPLVNQSGAERRTLSITDDGLLSLGRAVLADPRWLQRASPWRDTIKAFVGLNVVGSSRSGEVKRTEHFRNYNRWAIDDRYESWAGAADGVAGSSKWLQAVAFVFCEPPATSFVRTPDWLCAGVAATAAPLTPLRGRINGRPRGRLERPVTVAGRHARWHVHANQSAPSLRPCVDDHNVRRLTRTGPGAEGALPPWLWGVGSREVNPASAAEVAVATAIRPCVIAPPVAGGNASAAEVVRRMGGRVHQSGARPTRNFDTLMAALQDHSQAYDRTVFAAAPPEPPVSNSELLLAVIVVAPELVALVVLLVSTAEWRRRELLVLLFVFLAGFVSMAAAVQQVVREVSGAAWRGATLRDELSLDLLDTPAAGGGPEAWHALDRNLQGHLLFRTYSLILVAHLGYRVQLVALVAGGLAAVYLAVSLGVAIVVWRRRGRRPTVRPLVVHGDGLGGGSSGGGNGGSEYGVVWGGMGWGGGAAAAADALADHTGSSGGGKRRSTVARVDNTPQGCAV